MKKIILTIVVLLCCACALKQHKETNIQKLEDSYFHLSLTTYEAGWKSGYIAAQKSFINLQLNGKLLNPDSAYKADFDIYVLMVKDAFK